MPIRGRVLDAQGAALVGAEVRAIGSQGEIPMSSWSNSLGEFSLWMPKGAVCDIFVERAWRAAGAERSDALVVQEPVPLLRGVLAGSDTLEIRLP